MEIKKEYTNGDVTVVWQPKICIHSGNCVRGLGSAFKPKEKPWIQLEGENSDQIMHTVDQCPSGAITYYKNKGGSLNP